MKAIILARVSTEEQKEAGNSLPAQVERMRNYCQRKSFPVAKTFSFDESAYKSKRDEFDKILEYIKSSKEKVAVCFDKVDRFSRNIFDKRVAILYEMAMGNEIELHFASDNLVITSDISAVEKFHFGINLGLAKYYSDAISDNIKRAYEQKLRKGEWIGKAPIGYLNIQNDDETKDIVPDPERAHLIRRMFEFYATNTYSIKLLADEMKKLGLKSKQGYYLTTSMVYHVLKDSFYCGAMRVKGQEYPHKYQPLITRDLYQSVQAVMFGWNKKKFQYAAKPFIFRGLITCAACGGLYSPEIKKGKHIYYSCTNWKGRCKRVYVREAELLTPVYSALNSLKMPQERVDEVVEALRATTEAKTVYHRGQIERLRKEYDLIQRRTDALLEALLDKSITNDIYDKKLKEYKEKQTDLNIQLEEYTAADKNFYIQAGQVLSLASRAQEIFECSEVPEKRQLLNFLLQNCRHDGKNFEFSLKKPFDSIAELAAHPTGR